MLGRVATVLVGAVAAAVLVAAVLAAHPQTTSQPLPAPDGVLWSPSSEVPKRIPHEVVLRRPSAYRGEDGAIYLSDDVKGGAFERLDTGAMRFTAVTKMTTTSVTSPYSHNGGAPVVVAPGVSMVAEGNSTFFWRGGKWLPGPSWPAEAPDLATALPGGGVVALVRSPPRLLFLPNAGAPAFVEIPTQQLWAADERPLALAAAPGGRVLIVSDTLNYSFKTRRVDLRTGTSTTGEEIPGPFYIASAVPMDDGGLLVVAGSQQGTMVYDRDYLTRNIAGALAGIADLALLAWVLLRKKLPVAYLALGAAWLVGMLGAGWFVLTLLFHGVR